jgi:hypothetical protein
MAAKFDVDELHWQSCFHIRGSGQPVDLLGGESGVAPDSRCTSQNAMQRHKIVFLIAMPD